MKLVLKPGASQIRDLELIIGLGQARIEEALAHLENTGPLDSLRPGILAAKLESVLGAEQAGILAKQLVSLFGVKSDTGATGQEVISAVADALRAAGSTSVEDWHAVGKTLKSLLELPSVRIAANSIKLIYDHDRLLSDIRIISDIRPLFDDDGENIQGGIISFALKIRSDGIDGRKEDTYALDQKDVETLRLQCERALKKADTSKEFLTKTGVPAIITGEPAENG